MASTARQVGAVLGVAVLGSVVSSEFHRQLAGRLATARIPPAEKARLARSSVGASGIGAGGASVQRIVGDAFTAASHAGWAVATGVGLVLAVVGFWSAGPWAVRTAARAVSDLESST